MPGLHCLLWQRLQKLFSGPEAGQGEVAIQEAGDLTPLPGSEEEGSVNLEASLVLVEMVSQALLAVAAGCCRLLTMASCNWPLLGMASEAACATCTGLPRRAKGLRNGHQANTSLLPCLLSNL